MSGKSLKVTAHGPLTLPKTYSDFSLPGTPLPEGLHLSRERRFETVDPDISDAYELGLSSPMEFDGRQ